VVDTDAVRSWTERYIAAWRSNDAADIAALFTSDAVYRTGPFDEPRVGTDAIISGWLEDRDEPGDWTFTYEVLATEPIGVVEGRTAYKNADREYANVWLIDLDETGAVARAFTEYYMPRNRG
jgi:ketosteroid isomerase-like protein